MSLTRWVNCLPSSWVLARLRQVAKISNSNVDKKIYEDGLPVRLCNYTDVYYNDFIRNDMPFMKATATPAEIKRFQLHIGDVIITKDSETWDDIGIPAYVREELENVICGYHLTLLRPVANLYGGFLNWALQGTGIREQFWVEANGVTRFGLGQKAIKDLVFGLPPLPTQKAIADFLDRKTAAIDALIAKKQRLLELLAQQRQALITHAVTKGLNPDAPMKDSGIPWLGQIPAHWEIVKFGRIISVGPQNGISPPVSNDASGVESFSISVIRNGVVDVKKKDLKFVRIAGSLDRWLLRKGDILLVRGNGNIDMVGRAGIVQEEMPDRIFPDILMRIRLKEGFSPLYIANLINCTIFRRQIHLSARTTNGAFKVNNNQVRNFWMLHPPDSEVEKIAKALNNKHSKSFLGEQKLKTQITKLKEYRQALITAAVTGQIDVSTEAPFVQPAK